MSKKSEKEFIKGFLCTMPEKALPEYGGKILRDLGIPLNFYDWHAHTCVPGSDGEKLPGEFIEYAYSEAFRRFSDDFCEALGPVDAEVLHRIFANCCSIHVSITDHNTVAAYEMLKDSNVKIPDNMHLHKGMEVEAVDEDTNALFDVILLGLTEEFIKGDLVSYYLESIVRKKDELEDKAAETFYKAFKDFGLEIPELKDESMRYRRTGQRANDLAHDLMYKWLFEETDNSELLSKRETIWQPLIQYLVEHGYEPEAGRRTFYRMFVTCEFEGNLFYVSQTVGRKNLAEIATETLRLGGYVIIAHPGIYPAETHGEMMDFVNEKYNILKDVTIKLGFGEDHIGFEAVHRGMDREQQDKIMKFITEKGLIFGGGSDFHTENSPGNVLGFVDKGTRRITEDDFSKELLVTCEYH